MADDERFDAFLPPEARRDAEAERRRHLLDSKSQAIADARKTVDTLEFNVRAAAWVKTHVDEWNRAVASKAGPKAQTLRESLDAATQPALGALQEARRAYRSWLEGLDPLVYHAIFTSEKSDASIAQQDENAQALSGPIEIERVLSARLNAAQQRFPHNSQRAKRPDLFPPSSFGNPGWLKLLERVRKHAASKGREEQRTAPPETTRRSALQSLLERLRRFYPRLADWQHAMGPDAPLLPPQPEVTEPELGAAIRAFERHRATAAQGSLVRAAAGCSASGGGGCHVETDERRLDWELGRQCVPHFDLQQLRRPVVCTSARPGSQAFAVGDLEAAAGILSELAKTPTVKASFQDVTAALELGGAEAVRAALLQGESQALMARQKVLDLAHDLGAPEVYARDLLSDHGGDLDLLDANVRAALTSRLFMNAQQTLCAAIFLATLTACNDDEERLERADGGDGELLGLFGADAKFKPLLAAAGGQGEFCRRLAAAATLAPPQLRRLLALGSDARRRALLFREGAASVRSHLEEAALFRTLRAEAGREASAEARRLVAFWLGWRGRLQELLRRAALHLRCEGTRVAFHPKRIEGKAPTVSLADEPAPGATTSLPLRCGRNLRGREPPSARGSASPRSSRPAPGAAA